MGWFKYKRDTVSERQVVVTISERFDKAVSEMDDEELKKFFKEKLVEALVRDILWDEKTKAEIMAKIDWNQLTPALSALATKELADKIHRGLR